MKIPVIALFDIGKTNKKLFLIDEQYRIVWEKTEQFAETTDEDGELCEDLTQLTDWVLSSFKAVSMDEAFDIQAFNFSAYGASFVHLNTEGGPIAPLYNYLKPFSDDLKRQFYDTYGGEAAFARLSASPVLGNLNSGMQIYRLKYEKSEIFTQLKFSLHLPQYLSSILTGRYYSDITSIGCHTNLWNFDKNEYADWVGEEGILEKLPPIFPSDGVVVPLPQNVMDLGGIGQDILKVGVGLHDSSAALIPYLRSFDTPFLLISTGTWCISMNPFNDAPLTDFELQNDCLCYMTYQGKPVKSARLFAGSDHEEQVKRIAKHFKADAKFYKNVVFDAKIMDILIADPDTFGRGGNKDSEKVNVLIPSVFGQRNLYDFDNIETAYHQLMLDIMAQQVFSTGLVLNEKTPVQRIFVDGGFSKNTIYMHLLAREFPKMQVFAASVAQATAIGAALAIHQHWNTQPVPSHLIDLQFYA